jgi:hypothetical protein
VSTPGGPPTRRWGGVGIVRPAGAGTESCPPGPPGSKFQVYKDAGTPGEGTADAAREGRGARLR